CTITYKDMTWKDKAMGLEGDLSELIQHEYDHLDGVMAVSRAVDGRSFALRSQKRFLAKP
ncbi:MAG: peptide deformylase, partial [Desulfobacterales bacterium]|nr:peptide deformylase [Desulfobacterales bacterium]